jgi:glycosyltransferase involved in cell wall biosynthesis
MSTDESIRVLNLATTADSPVLQTQIETIEQFGVETTTLSLSKTRAQSDETIENRSVVDYLRYYPSVLRHSFGSYDLVHANYGLTAPAAIAQPNLPVVVSLWGSDLMGRYGAISKHCARYADEVVVMSEEMARELNRECHIIPHGVDVGDFRPMSRPAAREDIGWESDRKHVLFPYATTRDVKEYPRAERVVDAANERFDGAIELHTMSGVPHERVAVYMNAADALLLTSRREGSPNTVKEAMACNLPVVTTDVGDVRERLQGVNPSSVCRTDAELVNALVSVLEAGGRSNGRKAVQENLSLERMGRQLVDVYERALTD